jgi:hypothetical protein
VRTSRFFCAASPYAVFKEAEASSPEAIQFPGILLAQVYIDIILLAKSLHKS